MFLRLLFCTLAITLLYFLIFENFNSSIKIDDENENSSLVDESQEIMEEGGAQNEEPLSISVASHPDLSPDLEKYFLISFYFKEEIPPRYDRRQRLVTHYEADTPPYVGWAVAYRRFPTSSRFEFYLQNKDNQGGWFTFDSINIKENTWYAITFVLKPDELISSFFQPLSNSFEPEGKIIEFGGFSLRGIHKVQADSTLQVTSGKPEIGPFEGKVIDLALIKLDELPKKKEFTSIIKTGPQGILRRYPSDCIISLGFPEFSSDCLINP